MSSWGWRGVQFQRVEAVGFQLPEAAQWRSRVQQLCQCCHSSRGWRRGCSLARGSCHAQFHADTQSRGRQWEQREFQNEQLLPWKTNTEGAEPARFQYISVSAAHLFAVSELICIKVRRTHHCYKGLLQCYIISCMKPLLFLSYSVFTKPAWSVNNLLMN